MPGLCHLGHARARRGCLAPRVRLALENARVPVHLDVSADYRAATLTVMGCCVVPPPYTPEACACANAKVLERVRELVAEAR